MGDPTASPSTLSSTQQKTDMTYRTHSSSPPLSPFFPQLGHGAAPPRVARHSSVSPPPQPHHGEPPPPTSSLCVADLLPVHHRPPPARLLPVRHQPASSSHSASSSSSPAPRPPHDTCFGYCRLGTEGWTGAHRSYHGRRRVAAMA